MSLLAERIQAQAATLIERSIAEMYQNPCWQDRFGAGGRQLAQEDGQAHLSYLVQALVAADPGVMAGYARRLQTEIVKANMCSRHIDENFARLGRALAELVPDSDPARELLRVARKALVYEHGPERELQLLSDALAERTLDALWSRQTGWFAAASSYASLASLESITQAERARWKGDVLELLSFLADAIHAGRSELFSEYAVWVRAFFARRHAPAGRMEETLRALVDCVPRVGIASPPERVASPQPALRSSARPGSLRPPLSEPPPPPVPLPMSAEVAANARALIQAALERLEHAAATDRAEASLVAPNAAGRTRQ